MYIMNIHKFIMYMSFPILGQLIGLVLIYVPALYMKDILPQLAQKYEFFDAPSKLIALLLLAILPGLALFVSAFWKYLITYSSIPSMTQSAITSGKIYDFPAHEAIVYRNLWTYILLWLMISILMLLAFNPLLIVIGGIFFIYFILVFQIFTFESEKGTFGCFKESMSLVKGSFMHTFLLAILLFALALGLTYGAEVALTKVFNPTNFIPNFSWQLVSTAIINNFNSQLPLEYQLTPELISKILFSSMISFIIFGYTLPLRNICWTLWYKNLGGKTSKCEPNNKKKNNKRKRKVKHELDPEILRRAYLDDDEEV